jgi:hypothetical protein
MTAMIEPDRHKQLFLDDGAIESMSGVERVLHRPKKHGIALAPDRSRGQTSVQTRSAPQWNPETGLWEWWYWALSKGRLYGRETRVNHISVSPDGVDWEPLECGLYEWQGSRANSVAWDPRARTLYHIVRDERDPDPSRRYKAFFANGDNVDRYPGLSPDGFHWTFPHVDGIRSDDTSQLIYDDYNDRFAATVKQRTEWGRSVWLTLSDDFVEWSEPVLVLHTDETDQANRRERIRRVVEDPAYLSPPHVDEETDFIAQLYKMPFMPYEGQYVGLPLLFNPAGLDVPQMNHVGLNQTELAVSRDLLHWERVADREVFLGVEPWDGVNYGTCQVAVCGRPIVRDDEIWVYFMAVRFRGVPESYPPEYAEYFKDMGALELAKLRLDGFVSMDADGEGSIVTQPMEARGQRLHVNTEAAGSVRAAVLDAETMEPLPGYGSAECAAVHGDRLSAALTWPRGPLDAERPVRVRFELTNAKLYAFWLAE